MAHPRVPSNVALLFPAGLFTCRLGHWSCMTYRHWFLAMQWWEKSLAQYKNLLVSCRNVFLYKWKGLAVFDKYVIHPPLPPKLCPCLLWVTLYTDTKKKNSFIEACEGRHVHKSPLRSSIYCVVLIVYYSPCTAVFLQIWFTVSLIL